MSVTFKGRACMLFFPGRRVICVTRLGKEKVDNFHLSSLFWPKGSEIILKNVKTGD